VVDGAALEKRSPLKRSVGSNPTLSATAPAIDCYLGQRIIEYKVILAC
jgi:hypothetical protein